MLEWIADIVSGIVVFAAFFIVIWIVIWTIDKLFKKSIPAPGAHRSQDVTSLECHHKEPARDAPEKQDVPEHVEFAAFTRRSITPNCKFILDVWAYLSFQYSRIYDIAQKLDRDVNLGRKTGVSVSRGAVLSIKVDIPLLSVKDPVDTLVWTGQPANTSYIIEVPADTPTGEYPGKAVICCEGLTIARLVFLILISTTEINKYVVHSSETIYHKTAFASYVSENREEVLSRIQGMKKVAPDLDIFLDVFSLRSGDNWQEKLKQHVPTQDTFFLFWSHYAARSVWVEREWKLALKKRGLYYIDPVPLENLDRAPPPPELKSLHFSDAYAEYIDYLSLKNEYKKTRGRAKYLCDAGHAMDPMWKICPYCDAERRLRER